MELLHNEITIWEQLHHPNLVRLLDVFENEESLSLVTELMRGGDLFKKLEKATFFSEVVAAREMAAGVAMPEQRAAGVTKKTGGSAEQQVGGTSRVAPPPLPSLDIVPGSVSVSGISSGKHQQTSHVSTVGRCRLSTQYQI